MPQRKRSAYALFTIVLYSLCGIMLSACGGGRGELGTSVGPCYQILPVSHSLVPRPNTFVGVKLLSLNQASKLIYQPLASESKSVCVVAFKINSQQSSKQNRLHNDFYLVLVTPKTKQVLLAKSVAKLPADFRHSLSLS